MGVLARKDLVAAIIGRRFPSASQTTNAQRWLDTAYEDVWAAYDWPFKYVTRENLTVTAGDNTPTMPTAFGDVRGLYDAQGNELEYLTPEDFEDTFAQTLAVATTGTPIAFAVINRQIQLAPVPSANATFKHSYRRRLWHKQQFTGAVTEGPMNENDDLPAWDEHHGVLIPRAQAIGLLEINDPTWEQQQQEYERQLARMVEEYAPQPPTEQWGRANWYA